MKKWKCPLHGCENEFELDSSVRPDCPICGTMAEAAEGTIPTDPVDAVIRPMEKPKPKGRWVCTNCGNTASKKINRQNRSGGITVPDCGHCGTTMEWATPGPKSSTREPHSAADVFAEMGYPTYSPTREGTRSADPLGRWVSLYDVRKIIEKLKP